MTVQLLDKESISELMFNNQYYLLFLTLFEYLILSYLLHFHELIFTANKPNGLGVWLHKSIWFFISHQCDRHSGVCSSRSSLCSFFINLPLVSLSYHGTYHVLPCETVCIIQFLYISWLIKQIQNLF